MGEVLVNRTEENSHVFKIGQKCIFNGKFWKVIFIDEVEIMKEGKLYNTLVRLKFITEKEYNIIDIDSKK